MANKKCIIDIFKIKHVAKTVTFSKSDLKKINLRMYQVVVI